MKYIPFKNRMRVLSAYSREHLAGTDRQILYDQEKRRWLYVNKGMATHELLDNARAWRPLKKPRKVKATT